MIGLEVLLVIANLIMSLLNIRTKKQKIIKITLVLISFVVFGFGYILANVLIMDAIYPNKQIYSGNLIMIIFFIVQLLIFIKLIIDIFKNKKEGGKKQCQE